MAGKRLVKVKTSTGYTSLVSDCCKENLVTLGRREDGLIKCPRCNATWSLERVGLELVDGEYRFKEVNG